MDALRRYTAEFLGTALLVLAGVGVAVLAALVDFTSRVLSIVADGALMLALTLYVAIVSDPPLASAARNTIAPEVIEPLAITTLVGGTIGGYIVYAGAHRLLDSGVSGPGHVRDITRGSVTGILITAVMRVVLFLAILGVAAVSFTLAFASLRGRVSCD